MVSTKKKKGLLAVVLAAVLCFSVVFVVSAEQLPVKEKLIDRLTEPGLRFDPGFYEHASGSMRFQIDRLDGSLVRELEGVAGSTLTLDYKLHAPSQKMSFDFLAEAAGETYQGQFFIDGDKVIFTRDILDLIARVDPTFDLDELPSGLKYLYIGDEYLIGGIWEALADYRQGRMPQETRELLNFLVEAVPYKYLTLSGGKITLELDQAGFEDVIYHVLQKVQAEPERFADLVVGLVLANLGTVPAMSEDIDPEQMRAEIITAIETAVADGTFPGREEISMLAAFIQVKEFVYQSAIIPGGQDRFKAVFELLPTTGVTGRIAFSGDVSGGPENAEGEYVFELDLTTMENIEVTADLIADGQYQGSRGVSELTVTASARDLTTGEVLLDLKVTGEGTEQVTPDVTVNTPLLTADNSIDLNDLAQPLLPPPPPGVEVELEVEQHEFADEHVLLVVNEEIVWCDVPPYIKDGRTMVPVRSVAEALDCEVEWVSEGEIRIARGGLVVSMHIGKNAYTVNGTERQMDVPPYIKDGRTMVPVRFVAEALGAEVEFVGDVGTNMVRIHCKQ